MTEAHNPEVQTQHTEEVVREAAEKLLNRVEVLRTHVCDPHDRFGEGCRAESQVLKAADELQAALSSPSLEEGEREREIWINRGRFVVRGEAMQGDALRNIPTPPISENDDLFQVTVRSSEPDLLVRPDRLVDFKAGVEFFSAPKTIQAGND